MEKSTVSNIGGLFIENFIGYSLSLLMFNSLNI